MDLFARLLFTATTLATLLSGDVSNAGKAPQAVLSIGRVPEEATVLFAGDMMFDRTVRTSMNLFGDDRLFSCVDSTLAASDAVVANLEGPITDNPSVSVGSIVGSAPNFVFTFPDTTAATIAKHHVSFVNLGNNHIENFGLPGVESTIAALDKAHLAYFGDPISHAVATTTINGISVAFINYNQFIPTQEGSATTTLGQITEYKLNGYLPIVYTHWGIEYQPYAPEYTHELAHRFVDAGAVAVIGSHPHVVEESEIYKGAPIYYSLGNFIFDQFWDVTVTHGLMVRLTLGKGGVEDVKEIPIIIGKDTICPSV